MATSNLARFRILNNGAPEISGAGLMFPGGDPLQPVFSRRGAKSALSPLLSARFCFLLLTLLAPVLTLSHGAAAQILRIDPGVSRPTDDRFSLQVDSWCLDARVRGVEVVIEFDPALVHLDSIAPGPWFAGSGSGFTFRDYTHPGTGRIHFTGSLVEGTGLVDAALACCHFSAVGQGRSPLVFQEARVHDRNHSDLGVGHSTGDLIILDSAVRTWERSFGALKAIYR
jgi:hypothetical protein